MNDVQTAWLAGLLEGEGCFGDNHRGGTKIQLTMTDKDVVERVAAIFGSKVYCYDKRLKANRKPRYYTQIGGQKAADLIAAILPFMGIRRSAKIKSLLEYRSIAPGRGAHNRNRTACPYGHPLDGVEHSKKKGRFRYCKTCKRKAETARRAEIKAAQRVGERFRAESHDLFSL